eukprot:2537198-Rhodomonas_salina.6
MNTQTHTVPTPTLWNARYSPTVYAPTRAANEGSEICSYQACIKILLDANAEVDAMSVENLTPLHEACRSAPIYGEDAAIHSGNAANFGGDADVFSVTLQRLFASGK